ncbi:hypothetical protein HKX48_003635 [Thoreauomyces humboldtii]|nr:hypothetical protein HKX48_003635 [Thoreauomyces humboldtii]
MQRPPAKPLSNDLLDLFIDRYPLFEGEKAPPRRAKREEPPPVEAGKPLRKRHLQREEDGAAGIWSWAKVKREIAKYLGVSPRQPDNKAEDDAGRNGPPLPVKFPGQPVQALSVPHGLQHIHKIPTTSQVKNVLYVPPGISPYNYTPTQELWAVWDETGVGVWCRGRSKRVSAPWIAKGVVGWEAVNGWIVVAGGDMALRVRAGFWIKSSKKSAW